MCREVRNGAIEGLGFGSALRRVWAVWRCNQDATSAPQPCTLEPPGLLHITIFGVVVQTEES